MPSTAHIAVTQNQMQTTNMWQTTNMLREMLHVKYDVTPRQQVLTDSAHSGGPAARRAALFRMR